MKFLSITETEMDSFLKPEKGWQKERSGYEYLYNYRIPNTPIVVKVLSSVPVPRNIYKRNKGSYCIRVFAVVREGRSHKGLVKAQQVFLTEHWKEILKQTVINTIDMAKKRYYS